MSSVTCQSCSQPDVAGVVGDFDYTQLAGLRGKRVTLCDVTVFRCSNCAWASVEIPRLAPLHAELAAVRRISAKQIVCRYAHGEWSLIIGVA